MKNKTSPKVVQPIGPEPEPIPAVSSRRKVLRLLGGASAAWFLVGQTGCSADGVEAMGTDAAPPRTTPGMTPDGSTPPMTDAGVLLYDDAGVLIDAGPGDVGQDAGPGDAGHDSGVDGGPPPIECSATTPDALGPFFESGAPVRTVLASGVEPGERLLVQGSILNPADCRETRGGYRVDIWQATASGEYLDARSSDYRLRGQFSTAPDGTFAFETVRPGFYEITAGFRPAHIHLRVYRPSGASVLTTQLYFQGDPYLSPLDACGPPTCFSNDPARILSLTPGTVGAAMGQRTSIQLFV